MKGVFVTGTDTGIGKTVVSSILSMGLAELLEIEAKKTDKPSIKYWKPVQAGTDEATDSDFLKQMIGEEKILPESYRLKAPLSPNQSAEKEGVEIDLNEITSTFHGYQSEAKKAADFLVIEGAGGLMVPLNQKKMMIDLIKELAQPCLLVARSGLGTLNHTLMSINLIRAFQIPLLGVVMVGDENPSNKRDIENFGRTDVLLELPMMKSVTIENLREFQMKFSKTILQKMKRPIRGGLEGSNTRREDDGVSRMSLSD